MRSRLSFKFKSTKSVPIEKYYDSYETKTLQQKRPNDRPSYLYLVIRDFHCADCCMIFVIKTILSKKRSIIFRFLCVFR